MCSDSEDCEGMDPDFMFEDYHSIFSDSAQCSVVLYIITLSAFHINPSIQ